MARRIDTGRVRAPSSKSLVKDAARASLDALHGIPGFTERAASIRIGRLRSQQLKAHIRHGFNPSKAKELQEIVEVLGRQRDGRSTCNIIGSGMSALAALEGPSDASQAYFSCNFGGLLSLPYDLYLVEIGTFDEARFSFSELQKKTIESLPQRPSVILVKNVWESKLDGQYVADAYPDALVCIDALFPFARRLLQDGKVEFVFDRFFLADTRVLLQIYTSVLTLVQLAFRSGYSDIRVFGLDGIGPHFFHIHQIPEMPSVVHEVAERLRPLGKNEKHKVGFLGRRLAEDISPLLLREGVRLTLLPPATVGAMSSLEES